MFTPRPMRHLALRMLAATLALAATTAYAQAPTKIRFVLDWRFEGPSSLLLMGNTKGYYKSEGLDVTIDSGTGSGPRSPASPRASTKWASRISRR